MLKGLKNKKDGKADTKKDTKKDVLTPLYQKEPKGDTKKKQDEEEETNDALVDINQYMFCYVVRKKKKLLPKMSRKVRQANLKKSKLTPQTLKSRRKRKNHQKIWKEL